MDKNYSHGAVQEHKIIIDNRESISFTGVKDVGDFSEDQIQVYTVKGACTVKGKGLKVQKLDLDEGVVAVEGNIVSMIYSDKKNKEDIGLLGKIFK